MTIDAGPVSEADLSAFVLTLLDDHLAAMREIRDRLRPGGRVAPGGRHVIALESIALAAQYADRMSRALEVPQLTRRHPVVEFDQPML